MSPSSVHPVSTGYINFSILGIHSTRNQRPHSHIYLSHQVLTIAALSWWASKTTSNKLQWVLNAAARVVSSAPQVRLRLVATPPYWVFNCLHCQAPPYLMELCHPAAGVTSQQQLQSDTWQLLVVMSHWLSSYGRWPFYVAGPSVWNSLPDSLQDLIIGGNSFRLEMFRFTTYWCIQRIRGFTTMCYINQLFYLLLPKQHLIQDRDIINI